MPRKNQLNFTRDIPYLQPIVVETIQTYDRGSSRNGIHVEKWIHLPLGLRVSENWRTCTCGGCGSQIEKNMVVGYDLGESVRCLDCLKLPNYKIQAWKGTFEKTISKGKKNEKTKRITIYAVQVPDILAAYFLEIQKTYVLKECETLWTYLPPQSITPSQNT